MWEGFPLVSLHSMLWACHQTGSHARKGIPREPTHRLVILKRTKRLKSLVVKMEGNLQKELKSEKGCDLLGVRAQVS